MPTTAPPLPIKISSEEEGDLVVFYLREPLKGRQGEIPIMMISKIFLDEHPWMFPQLQLLMHKLGQDILAKMGYQSEVKQVAPAIEPQPESTIILDPIEETKRNRSH
jgi:hypothetical protein